MNITHLRKQAKNLVKHYPDLIASNPSALPLSGAQTAIARINGFPSWEAMLSSIEGKAKNEAQALDLSTAIYLRIDDVSTSLPSRYTDGDPSHFKDGYEAVFKFKQAFNDKVDREDDRLTEYMESIYAMGMGYDEIPHQARGQALLEIQRSLSRCPYNIEAYGMLAGIHFANRQFDVSLQVVEPIAKQLLAMIPSDERYLHINYGSLSNRPFHRLMHNYVLSLGKAGRDNEASSLAKRMVKLWPNDNIGFRFLTSKKLRDMED